MHTRQSLRWRITSTCMMTTYLINDRRYIETLSLMVVEHQGSAELNLYFHFKI